MFKIQLGEYVEEYVLDMFEDLFGDAFRESTEEEDRYLGTDCFINDVPIDITVNPDKDRCKFIKTHMLEGITVHVMKRYGNAFVTFDRPVLVFHFDAYDLKDRMLICELIEEGLTRDIVSEMLGLYN